MKAKTIKAILRKKTDDWLSTIEDDAVRALARKNTIITGGCIASMLLQEKVNDYDLYFRNAETAYQVANYYITKYNDEVGGDISLIDDREEDRIAIMVQSVGIEGTKEDEAGSPDVQGDDLEVPTQVETGRYRPVFFSMNAISLSNKIQLVTRFYGEPDQIHENYDFVHCTNSWDSWTGKLTLRPDALESLLTRELRYVGSKYPLCSIIRTRKFVARQWTINAGQYVKMAFQLQEHDLNDPAVLEEQLTGVDIHYFFEVITALKERDSKRVDTAYLMEVIDRIF
jgi:hypothetical protein